MKSYLPTMDFCEMNSQHQFKETPSASFTNLQSEFDQIPDISITLKLYADLIQKLKSTKDHNLRIQYMMQFSSK